MIIRGVAERSLATQKLSGNCLTAAEALQLVSHVDRDGDGSLDYEEFVKIMMDKWDLRKNKMI